MFSTSDTIVAIATPPGRGGIGVVRLSGPDAHAIAGSLARACASARTAPCDVHRGPAEAGHNGRSKTCAAASGLSRTRRRSITSSPPTFPRPHSYTGEDVVELSAHGSPVVLRAIVAAATACWSASRRAGGVHAAGVSQRPDRSAAGRGGRRSDRRRHAAAGTRGVRSAPGDADGGHRGDRCGAVRSHRAPRGVGRFSGRGLSLHRARARWPARSTI